MTMRALPSSPRRRSSTVRLLIAITAVGMAAGLAVATCGGPAVAPSSSAPAGAAAADRHGRDPRGLAARPGAGAAGLTGVVRDERGAEIAGAVVAVSGHPALRTDARGRFAVGELAAGAYHVTASAGDAAAGPVAVDVGGAPAFVELTLRPGIGLTVDVVSVVDGAPLPGARGRLELRTATGGAGALDAVADAGGVLRFPAAPLGNYRITADADGFAPATELVTWNERAGTAWSATIALEPGVALTGRVTDARGAPIAGAEVRARPVARATTLAPYRPRPPDPLRPAVVTDADGRFRYPVPTGQRLALVATHDRYARGETAELTAAAPAEVAIVLDDGRALAGRVVDAEGHPVAGAVVADAPSAEAATHTTRTGADGGFTLAGIEPERQRIAVFASTPEATGDPAVIALPDQLDQPVELVLAHRRQVAGTVVDAGGAPVADAIVGYQRVLPDPAQAGGSALLAGPALPAVSAVSAVPATAAAAMPVMITGELRAGPDGRFTIRGLADGDYRLSARAPGAAAGRAASPAFATQIAAAGAEDVALTLPAAARIRGRVTIGGRTATAFGVELVHAGGERRFDAADGSFELAQVPPAAEPYQLRVTADGAAPVTVEATVAAGEITELGTIALDPGRVVRGRVVDATGPGGGAVAGAVISVEGPEGDRIASARTDALGRFAIPVPLDPVVVHAAMPGVGGSRFELVPLDRDTVELRLPETGRLEVGIAGAADGEPVTVTATRTDARDGGIRVWVLDRVAPGRFGADVAPGDYVVRATRETLAARTAPAAGVDTGAVAVVVDAGQLQRVAVEVPAAAAPGPGG
jgi:hypothetical protein